MNEKAITMKIEIRAIANYRGVIISKRFLTLFLGLISLYLGVIKYAMSPLYILIILSALPPILSFALKDYAQKYKYKLLIELTQDKPFLLNVLKRKYKYSKVDYVATSISYLLALIFIGLWQYNYTTLENIHNTLEKVPVLILAAGLVLRFLTIIFYRIKLPYDLSHNRV
jgi:hypothetical protein